MEKKKSKLVLSGALILGLSFPAVASAYSSSYSFDVGYSLEGTKKYSLSNKTTKTTAKANTYNSAGNVQSNKSNYRVSLYKSLLTDYSVSMPADGYSYTKSFGKVSKGSYTININKSDNTGYGSRVKGSGTINQ
ncbi:hypothetical protein [Niallia sp. FSL W8-0954]|uniref:hypothetical protein n=1 Tax=Niallia sp. FSL W8-0954 TaxID=2975338 RepID=UPI0030FAB7BD